MMPQLYSWVFTPEKCKRAHTETRTQMAPEALFTRAPNWKTPRCSSVGKWLNHLWCTHAMEHNEKEQTTVVTDLQRESG